MTNEQLTAKLEQREAQLKALINEIDNRNKEIISLKESLNIISNNAQNVFDVIAPMLPVDKDGNIQQPTMTSLFKVVPTILMNKGNIRKIQVSVTAIFDEMKKTR